jgi:HK97 family phage major capsid protein
MDTLKLKKEDRVKKEDAYMVLATKAAKEALSTDETAQLKTLETEISGLDSEIETLEKAEVRAKEIAKRQSANVITSKKASGEDSAEGEDSEHKELVKIANRFSVGRAFKRTFARKNIDGVEAEVYEIAKKEAAESGVQLEGNIAIPQKFIQIGKRKLLSVATEGADVVFTEYGGKVIPYLNPLPVADEMGVTFLSGLNGNVQWPRETGDLAFAFETESSDVDETTPTFDNISISPKRFGGYVDVTLQMKQQSVFVIDQWLRNKLTLRYALTVDNQIFNGTGSGNQTTGLFNFSGVNTLSLGSGGSGNDMTYRALLSMKRDTKVANARMGKAGWVTNAYGEFALFNTPMQTSGVEGNFILKPDYNGKFIGDPFRTSEIIPANGSEGSQTDLCAIAYSSNWAGLIVGFWGGMDLTYDPYTQKLGGKDRFVVNAFMDVDIEQPLEFSICKDWDASDLPALT